MRWVFNLKKMTKKDFKLNLLGWGLPFFFIFCGMHYKDFYSYFRTHDYLGACMDLSVIAILCFVGTYFYTLLEAKLNQLKSK